MIFELFQNTFASEQNSTRNQYEKTLLITIYDT
jgi:hypothetical protein